MLNPSCEIQTCTLLRRHLTRSKTAPDLTEVKWEASNDLSRPAVRDDLLKAARTATATDPLMLQERERYKSGLIGVNYCRASLHPRPPPPLSKLKCRLSHPPSLSFCFWLCSSPPLPSPIPSSHLATNFP